MKSRRWRAAYLLWIAGPMLAFGIYKVWGLPHVIWSYSFQGGKAGFASRVYTSCTFVGPYGAFTTPATEGSCGWIAFFKAREVDQ